MSAPTVQDQKRLRRVVRFLRGAPRVVTYLEPSRGKWEITARSDTDWAADKIGRKSTTCGQIFVNGALVQQFVRSQGTPALSSPEAEFNGVVSTAAEGIGAQSYMTELLLEKPEVKLETDNNSAQTNVTTLGVGK